MRRGPRRRGLQWSRRDATLCASVGRATCRSFRPPVRYFLRNAAEPPAFRVPDAATVIKIPSLSGKRVTTRRLAHSMARGEARCLVCETPSRVDAHRGVLRCAFPREVRRRPLRPAGARARRGANRSASKTVTVSESHAVWHPNPPLPSDSAISPFLTPRPSQPKGAVSLVRRAAAQARFRGSRAPLRPLPRRIRHGRQEYHLFVPDHPPTPSRPVTSAPASSTSTPRVKLARAARSSTSPPSPTRPPRARPSSSSASDATASSAPISPRDARSYRETCP